MPQQTAGPVVGGLNLHPGLRHDIDGVLEQAIGSTRQRHPRLNEAMRYAAIGGGKRFRAMLVVAAGDLVGAPYEQAIRVGAAIECVHAQSLVHDDLPCMDDDDMRRGRPTVHRQFGEATAVLAGDALLALAFEILAAEATHPDAGVRARLVLNLARALGQDGLAGGQMMDLHPAADATAEDVLVCERRKTGSLIRFAVDASALLGGCSDAARASLLRFADTLGLMFQVRDDILDETGDAAIMGKAVRKDGRHGRKSMTVTCGLDGATRKVVQLERACHDALAGFGMRAAALRGLAEYATRRMA